MDSKFLVKIAKLRKFREPMRLTHFFFAESQSIPTFAGRLRRDRGHARSALERGSVPAKERTRSTLSTSASKEKTEKENQVGSVL